LKRIALQTGKAFRSSGRFLNAVFKFSDNAEVCNARMTSNSEVMGSPSD
jgi:hypothetical protein